MIRHDPEGCFRGIKLEEWAAERGILLEPCPAEDHGQIGVVESLIGKIKQDFRTLLSSEEMDPFLGILGVFQAHNHLDRIGGFAPSQWAYGRLPSFDGRFFEGGNDLPIQTSEGAIGTSLHANLNIRVKAEEVYRRTQALDKINRALNTQPRKFQVFLPGDLVYYRRYKTPSQLLSHEGVDKPKIGVVVWASTCASHRNPVRN